MRLLVILFGLSVIAACTKPNPSVCCAATAQCDALGVDDLRPCEVGQACQDFKCVAAECQSAMDCDAASPICSHGLCISTCSSDEDCMEVAGREHCSAQGACVGCTDASQCPTDATICDASELVCRGCELDAECSTGVCIEIDGVCATEDQLLYVQATGSSDTGSCTRTAPCASIGYAVQRATATRNVIRVTGGGLFEAEVTIDRPVVIDGAGTSIGKPDLPVFSLANTLTATIEGMIIRDNGSDTVAVIEVPATDTLRLGPGTQLGGRLHSTGATVTMDRVDLQQANVRCESGTLSLVGVHAVDAAVDASSCDLSISRSILDAQGDRMLAVSGGHVAVDDTVFLQRYELADSITIQGCSPGSTFRFNTVVNTSGVDSDGQALFCDATLDVTSNIFAYASGHPMGFPNGAYCHATYSLFDDVAVPLHSTGEGNKVAAPASFFVNRAGGDLHLAPGSPAIDAADPAQMIETDYDGWARSGGPPDMGAFESH